LAISPNGAQAYAVDEGSRSTFVVDTASNTLIGSIPTWGGGTPNSIAVAPDQPPRAALSVSGRGMLATLKGNASTDSDGRIATYSWDFGDGSGAKTSAPTVRHAFVDPGEYTEKLTLTD